VVFVALQWGIGPAIVTAVLSGLAAQFFVLPATYMVPLQGADKIAGWLTFFLICAVIIGLARACRSASKRLALAHRQLQLERDAFDDFTAVGLPPCSARYLKSRSGSAGRPCPCCAPIFHPHLPRQPEANR
jgi:hypothetical protein